MIQRIQTLFMAAAILFNVGLFFTPSWIVEDPESDKVATLNALSIGISQADHSFGKGISEFPKLAGIPILIALSIVLLLLAIFKFENRPLQIKLLTFVTILFLVEIVLISLISNDLGGFISSQSQGEFRAGFFLPVLALFSTFLAVKYIKKDDALVKSVDRFR